MDKFAKDIVLLLRKSNLLVKYNLNLFDSLVLAFSVLINMVSIFRKLISLALYSIHQMIGDSF